jgi:hypothetical protein
MSSCVIADSWACDATAGTAMPEVQAVGDGLLAAASSPRQPLFRSKMSHNFLSDEIILQFFE